MFTPLNALHPYDLLPLKANCLNGLSYLISTNKEWIEDYLAIIVFCLFLDGTTVKERITINKLAACPENHD